MGAYLRLLTKNNQILTKSTYITPVISLAQSESDEEADFNWEEYLEETGATAAPHTAFKHVDISLQSSFQPGMKLEVANKSSPDTYWVATIVTTCGQLLLLRFSGYGDDRKADFWCDVMTSELHPVGWCSQNNKTLQPPEAIKEKYSDWTDFLIQDLTGSRTAPANLLEGPLRGKNTVDLIVEGSVIEVRDLTDPSLYWAARVAQNVGGRLRLRHVGLQDDAHDTWLFYLDVRLRPLGWAQENRLSLEPPAELRGLKSALEWQEALEAARSEAQRNPLPLEVFKDHADLTKHSFRTGMKLEMVSPSEPFHICPVSVTQVYNEHYFQVTVDDLTPEATPLSLVCHSESPGILPVQWCLKNGIGLERPRGYLSQDFDWADYLKQSGTETAPDACFPDAWQSRGFAKDMWLEAVNPVRPTEVCVAQITQVRGRLLWLRLEGEMCLSYPMLFCPSPGLPKSVPECIVDVESMDIFPVGWCETNAYLLTPPLKPVCKYPHISLSHTLAPPQPVETIPLNLCEPIAMDTANGRYCCSRIYVNHRCFSGPYLNKGRIAELPQAVGPGKCTLVLKEVLSMLINAAYKPGRVLRELQDVEDQHWDCHEETLKAKYKGKTYRSSIRIVRLAEQIPDFCRKVCGKLQCCPNLFSPVQVTDQCPESCSMQTKTKYTYYYGKKKKLSKPFGGEESLEAKPTRRRKKRKAIFVQKKRRSSAVDYTPAGSPQSIKVLYGDESLCPVALQVECSEAECQLVLERNPLEWSVEDVVTFITSTDCAALANIFQEQDIDGQALLLLTLPTVQECMELKLGPAIKLCHQIERVKVAFYAQYAN
uniref:Scm like with four mbt domains 2 n=1 Tax=Oncorhynchus kisutch TaxID=8019 RepID=A0A8C7CII1_ONCKI